LNEISNLKNNKKYYYKNLRKYINITIHNVGMIMDQPGKRNYLNYARGNSDYRPKLSFSYNFKDISINLPSYKKYKNKLSKRIDENSCSIYLN